MEKPCPMCGRIEDLYLDIIKDKEHQKELIQAFLAGRKSERKFSRRENEIFDAFYDLEIQDFDQIAYNFNISESSVVTYYNRAMDKLTVLLRKEIWFIS